MVKKKSDTKTLTKTQPTENKIKKISKKKTKSKTKTLISSSDSDTETSIQTLEKLLEPYPKDQLITILATAALTNPSLSETISAAAERDVSHRKIFVHGLGWDANKETLVAAFKEFGEIEDCNVILDRGTGKSKGYGFVLFKGRKGADKALKEPSKKIGNRIASCQLSSVGPVGTVTPTAITQQDGMGRKIYISNVPTDVDPEKLRTFFAKFGEIETGPLGFDSRTGKSRGFALFVYKTVESAKMAIQEQFKSFDGHQLRCQKAIENKNALSGAATITTAVLPMQPMQQPPMLAASMAAAQNLALMSQQYQFPGLNPLYSGLLTNPMLAAQGYVGPGQLGGYGATGPGQIGGFGSTGLGQASGFGSTGLGQASGFGSTGLGQASGFGSTGLGQTGGFGSSGLGQTGGLGSTGLGQTGGLGSTGLGQTGGFGSTGLGQTGGFGSTGLGQSGGFGSTGLGQTGGFGSTGPSQLGGFGATVSGEMSGHGATKSGQIGGVGSTGLGQLSGYGSTGPGQLGGYGSTGPGQLGGFGSTGLGQLGGFGSTGPSQLSEFGSTGSSQVNKLGGGLGSYGASGSGQLGLQKGYLGAPARTPGAGGGSYSGLTNSSFKRTSCRKEHSMKYQSL